VGCTCATPAALRISLSLQVIHDRSVRHADDIAARKRELGAALAAVNAELWVTDRSERLALLQQVLEQYQAWFVDEEYDEDFRRRIGRDIGFITHQIDDLLGDLPTRAQLTVDMGNVELPAVGTRWVQVPSDATAPTPPEPPNGGVWVELYRTQDLIFYESEDGEASVDLTLKSDGKRKYLEWGIVEWIRGLGRSREAWDAQRSDPPMSYHGESGG
jgi:hypothetical protein